MALAAMTAACVPFGASSETRTTSSSRAAAPWTASWGAAVQPAHADPSEPEGNWSESGFGEETLRQVVRLSVGGPKLRVRLSNAYGTRPLKIAGATVARSDGGAKARPGTLLPLTFGGSPATTVPVGKDITTDEVPLPTTHREELVVSLRFAAPTGRATVHRFTTATSYRAPGDHLWSTASESFDRSATPPGTT
ncbi:hypothetical protein QWM81_08550 [Streptomyces ficellus]|uniref:SGNH/GDSL hydrolase family protein n=1 Tax=Streptomyces ficellus TaxID=1977088 RepID=A0ABT7Z3N1_9ACTN|nr:hypothetical protein [Streptomyces ficellus]MDN3294096.1 hypothetical protein [Streptomyces ficellus]